MENKDTFRKKYLSKVKKYNKINSFLKNKNASRNLELLLKKFRYKSILFYLPLKIEVNIKSLINKNRMLGKKVFVPFMEGESFKMVKYRLPIKKAKYNIYQSANSKFIQKNVDIAIVPVIGIDKNFKRIGWGKGIYDRFFYKLKEKPIIIFIQISKSITNKKITNKYDVKGDFYISPKNIISTGNINVYNNINNNHRSNNIRYKLLFHNNKNTK